MWRGKILLIKHKVIYTNKQGFDWCETGLFLTVNHGYLVQYERNCEIWSNNAMMPLHEKQLRAETMNGAITVLLKAFYWRLP